MSYGGGRTVTRVYNADQLFPWPHRRSYVEFARGEDRWWIGLNLRLVPNQQNQSVALHLGPSTSLDLTSLAQLAPPHLSSVQAEAKAGDRDGINLPWFTNADAALLFWEIHGGVSKIFLRARVTEPGVVEIWPDSNDWNTREPLRTPAQLEPILTISGLPLTPGSPADISNLEIRVPAYLESSSPSRTFQARCLISAILVPTGAPIMRSLEWFVISLQVAFFIFRFCIHVLVGYALIVAACWVLSGRPAFRAWSRQFALTKDVYRRLTGESRPAATGPTADDGDGDGTSEPKALRNVGDFFKSRSPLDDLLATFECTQVMLRPLNFQRRTAIQSGGGEQQPAIEARFKTTAEPVVAETDKDIEKVAGLDEKKDTNETKTEERLES